MRLFGLLSSTKKQLVLKFRGRRVHLQSKPTMVLQREISLGVEIFRS
jgi:hypothetical protein